MLSLLVNGEHWPLDTTSVVAIVWCTLKSEFLKKCDLHWQFRQLLCWRAQDELSKNTIIFVHLGRTGHACNVLYGNVTSLVKSPWFNQVSFVYLGDFGTKYGNAISVEYAYPILENEIDSESLYWDLSNGLFRMWNNHQGGGQDFFLKSWPNLSSRF